MSDSYETQYLELLNKCLTDGVVKGDRTGVGTRSLFAERIKTTVTNDFPLLTTKRLYTRAIFVELEWFLLGETNVKFLQDRRCSIWNEWAREGGDLGPVYGKQWRYWRGPVTGVKPEFTHRSPDRLHGLVEVTYASIDQIAEAIRLLREDPFSRRNVVSAWNVADLPDMALSSCHCLFQLNCRPMHAAQRAALLPEAERAQFTGRGFLDIEYPILDDLGAPKYFVDLQMYQRSADIFLGVPFNVASYALLLHVFARCAGRDYVPGDLTISFGDLHLYSNHVDQAREQLNRALLPSPRLDLLMPFGAEPWDFRHDAATIVGYSAHPSIAAPVAV